MNEKESVRKVNYPDSSRPLLTSSNALRVKFEKENVNKIAVKHFIRHPVTGADVREGM